MKRFAFLSLFFVCFVALWATDLSVVFHGDFAPQQTSVSREDTEIHYDGNPAATIGGGAGTFIACARFTPDELGDHVGSVMKQVKFFLSDNVTSCAVKIYRSSTPTSADEEIHSQPVPDFLVGDWTVVDLTSSIEIETGYDYWVGYEIAATGGGPMCADGGPMVTGKGAWLYLNNAWYELIGLGETPLDYNWNIRLVVGEIFEHDVTVKNIIIPKQVDANETQIPQVEVRNVGLNEETFDLHLEIRSGDNEIYNQIQNLTIAQDSFATITFPEITTLSENDDLMVTAYTALEIDSCTTNDTLRKRFNTYTIDRDLVVMEMFTGGWCQYCPGAAMGADDMVENGHDIAIIEYHYADPYQNVPSDARHVFYGVASWPSAFMDGTTDVGGGSTSQSLYPYYLGVYNDVKQVKTVLTMDVQNAQLNGQDLQFSIQLDKSGVIRSDDVVLHVALTESEIPFNWQNQTQVDFVERAMLPDYNGTAVTIDGIGQESFDFSTTLDATWATEHCEIVAFVQDTNTKEIYQGAKLSLASLLPAENAVATVQPVTELGNYPNPFNPETQIQFSVNNPENANLKIYNVKGELVKTFNNFHKGVNTVLWKGRNNNDQPVASGIYFYQLQADGQKTVKKMALMK